MFSGKVWFAPDVSNDSAIYTEFNAAVPLGGFTLGLHAGYSFGDAWEDIEHFDYSIGLTKSFSHLDFNLKYVDSTDLDVDGVGRSSFIGTVSTNLPWRD